jgi:hypothetical protein
MMQHRTETQQFPSIVQRTASSRPGDRGTRLAAAALSTRLRRWTSVPTSSNLAYGWLTYIDRPAASSKAVLYAVGHVRCLL